MKETVMRRTYQPLQSSSRTQTKYLRMYSIDRALPLDVVPTAEPVKDDDGEKACALITRVERRIEVFMVHFEWDVQRNKRLYCYCYGVLFIDRSMTPPHRSGTFSAFSHCH